MVSLNKQELFIGSEDSPITKFRTARHQALLRTQLERRNSTAGSSNLSGSSADCIKNFTLNDSPSLSPLRTPKPSQDLIQVFSTTPQGNRLRRLPFFEAKTVSPAIFEWSLPEARLKHFLSEPVQTHQIEEKQSCISLKRSQSSKSVTMFDKTVLTLSIPKIVKAEHSIQPSVPIIEQRINQVQHKPRISRKKSSLRTLKQLFKIDLNLCPGESNEDVAEVCKENQEPLSLKGKIICVKSPRDGQIR